MASNIWHAGLICVSPASWPDCGKVRSSWMRSGGGIGSSVKHCDITCMAGSSNHPFDSTPPETQSPVVPSRVTQRTAQPTAGFRVICLCSVDGREEGDRQEAGRHRCRVRPRCCDGQGSQRSVDLRGACSARATDALNQQNQAPEKQQRTPDEWGYARKIDQRSSHGNELEHRQGQPLLGDEHADQFGGDLFEYLDHAKPTASFRARVEAKRPAPRNKTANKSSAKSCPGQAMPSPSPVQNTPKADNITPTPNLRVFSGTRDSGRWTIAPTARTRAQAASAPRLAGTSKPRPAPTAITMKTTSRPSSKTALNAVTPAAQPRFLCRRRSCSVNSAASAAKMASSSCKGMTPAARSDAFLSHPMPKSSSMMPIASCSAVIGTRSRSGPNNRTIAANNPRPAFVPRAAGRHPRKVATASTMVKASTTSTIEARNAALTAGAAVDRAIMFLS